MILFQILKENLKKVIKMFSKTRRTLFILFLVKTSFLLVTPVALANTSHSVCQTPSLTIPNNNSTGVSDTLTISDSGKITDINVIIDANHGHLGELIFRLEHEGTTVTLLEKPGLSDTAPKGCYGQNIANLTVDDEGTRGLQNDCRSYDPGYENTVSYQPKDSLSRFDDKNITGDWTLTVSDNYDFNSKEGTLNKWCIKYERVSQADFSSTLSPGSTIVFNDKPIVDEGQIAHYSFDISESANIEDLIIYSADITGTHASDFELIDPDPSVFPFTIQLGTTQTFKLACEPSAGGEHTAILTLKTNVTAFPTITYPLSCTGLAASYYSSTMTGSTLNLGEAEVNTAVSQTVDIQETSGLRDLILKSATITGNSSHKDDFEIVNPTTFPHTIAKGNTTPFQFEVKCTPSVGGKRKADLTLTTNDPVHQTINYKLECTGLAPVYKSRTVTPNQTFRLGSSEPGNSTTRSLDIRNTGTTDLEVSFLGFTGDGASIFSINLSVSLSISPWKTETLTVQCKPVDEKLYTATLQLATTDPSQPTVDYPVTCEGSNVSMPLYESMPSPGKTISFGSQVVGKTLDKTIEILELGNDTLKVSLDTPALTGHQDDFSVGTAFPIDIIDGGSAATVTVQCKPTKGGLRTATLNLMSNDASNLKIIYTLKCRGKAAGYSSTPFSSGETLDFGKKPVGQTLNQTIEIQEIGDADLTVDLATTAISGAHAKDFEIMSPNFPITIANNSGDKINVTVQCRPGDIGERTAKLHLTSNDPLNPTPTYFLKCSGQERVGPAYASTPLPDGEPINFGSTPVGVPVTQTFDIKEVGTSVLDVGLDKPDYLTGDHADDFSVKLPEPDTFDINSFFIRDGDPSQMITLECKPSSEGKRKAILHLISSDSLNPKPTYQLECTGTAPIPTPDYSSTPAPGSKLDFGSPKMGATATQTIEIQEVGDADLTVDLGSLTGESDFTIVSPSSAITIADGGAAQIVTLQCQPSSVGKKTAQLKLTSNDPNNATLLYDLECTGTSATLPTPPTPSTPSSPITEEDSKGSAPSTKTLIVELAGKGKGRVKSEPLGIDCDSDDQRCYSAYDITTLVSLHVEAAPGSVFDHWEACSDGQILMINHHACVVYFKLLQGTLTVTTVGNGQVSSLPVGIDCGNSGDSCRHTYEGGPLVTLTAIPDAGWQFEGWTGQCDDRGSVTLLSDKRCEATFVQKMVQPPTVPVDAQVNVAIAGKGKGRIKSQPAGIDCGIDCIADYAPNTVVSLTATPIDNSIFTHWEGDCSGTSNPIRVNLDQAKSCNAYFALPSVKPALFHTLTVEKIGKGRVMSTSKGINCGEICSASYTHNTQLNLMAIPDTGFEFTGFSGNCAADGHLILDTNQYCVATFVPINKAGSLQFSQSEVIVNEEITQLVVTVTRTGDSEGAVSVDYVSSDETALQGADYTAVNGTLQWEDGDYANKTFTVVIHDDGETEETESLRLTLSNVKGGAALALSTVDVIIYDNDSLVPSISVNYTLTVTKTGTGTGAVNSLNTGIICGDHCTQVYPSETKVILIAQAESGSRFIGWDGACHGNNSPFSVTLTADRICEAKFDLTLEDTTTSSTPESDLEPENATTSPTPESPVPETPPTLSDDKTISPDHSSGSSSCLVTGTRIDGVVCNLRGKQLENVTIGSDASLSNMVLKGTINNQGWISNATLLPNSSLTGGILTGYITNQGTLTDIEFRGALLTGGMLAKHIINNSSVGGTLQDVDLAEDAEITGGKVAGKISGDPKGTARLNNLMVTSGSCLTDVIIGEDVELAEDVKYGPGVKLIADPDFIPDITFICLPMQANGQTFKNVVIEPEGELANAVLAGTIENKGEASDITLQADSELTGGKLRGEITNQGTLTDIHLQDGEVTGGTLAGDIKNDAVIQEVSLAPNTTIRGGKLQGPIIGISSDAGQPARLESLSIGSGSHLENVIVGDKVTFSKEVTLKNVTIDKKGRISRGLLEGTIQNEGRISNATLQKDSHLIGGILSGEITNHGTIEDARFYGKRLSGGILAGTLKNGKKSIIEDVVLAPNAQIIQGQMQGSIQGDAEQPARLDGVTIGASAQVSNVILDGKNVNNEGTIADAEFRGLLMTGGTLSDNIRNTMGGTIKDVSLAPNTTISGGNLQGDIIGDRSAPALLENVFIAGGSYLENVVIGDNVTLAKNVILGPGVSYKNKKQVETEQEEPVEVLTALRLKPNGSLQEEKEADFVINIRSHDEVVPNHAMLSYLEAEWLHLSSTIQIVPEEVDQAAELIVAAIHQDDTIEAFSMRDGKKWIPWDNDLSSLETAQIYPHLPNSLEDVFVYEGDLTDIAPETTFMSNGHLLSLIDTAGEYTFTVGYRLIDGSIVFNGLEPIHFFVERAPASCILYALHDGGLNNSQVILIDLSAGLHGNMQALGPKRKGRDMEGMALDPSDSEFLLASAGDHARVKNETTGQFEEPDGYLYRIHRETGELEIIGPTGFDKVAGLAINPADQTLWGWGRNNEKYHEWSGMIRIDPISGMGTPIKQFDYNLYDMGALAWSYDGSQLYTASDEHLWVYDPETQELEIACEHVDDGKIEGLDLQPNGFLLVGVDRGGQNNQETSILAYDPVNCNIVHKRVYDGLRYNDIESIVWPASQCNDMSWLSDQESEVSEP